MAFEFEALVGHLYVVGGRSISAPPPGALVEVAPRKVARGRESDTFFTLVLPTGEGVAPANFYEGMATLAAETYFESTSSVTSGLRAVFNTLNENLYNHNQRDPRHYEASLICAVMRGTDLYLGRVGGGVALYRHQGETQPFPADFANDEALIGPPLGVQPIPDVKMAMYGIVNGTRMVVADTALADIEYKQLVEAMGAEDIGAALVALKDHAPAQITLTMVEFVPPEAPSPLPIKVGESTAELMKGAPIKGVSPEVAPIATLPITPSPDPAPREPRVNVVERAAGGAAIGAARVLDGANNALDTLMPPPEPGTTSAMKTPFAIGLALLIPIIVVIAVVALWLGGTGETEFDQCVSEVNNAATSARGINTTDVQGTIAAWNAVAIVVTRCNEIRPDDPQMAALLREARAIGDQLLEVERRPVNLIHTLPSATLTHAVLQGEDLYVLDDANDLVYRLRISTEGLSLATGTREEPIPSMRREGIVNQFTIGNILDIAWADDGTGLSQGNVITALDDNGVLIDCPPRFLQSCRAQQLNIDTVINPVAIHYWQGRLYVLDPGANQLWRYDPSGGAFPNAPTEYFVGEGRPDIRGAVDFAIDTPGSVYMLFENGILARFTGGLQEGFQFANFPEARTMTRANSFNMNPNPPRQGMYFGDRSTRTIYETTMAGTFVNAYRAEEEILFDTLGDVVVDTNKQIVYALAGSSVYAFNRQP